MLLTIPTRHRNEPEITKEIAKRWGCRDNVQMPDGTYCDLVTRTHAIEVDWPNKWHEAIGQALHYASQCDRKPGILILTQYPETEWQQILRAAYLAGIVGAQLWVKQIPKDTDDLAV